MREINTILPRNRTRERYASRPTSSELHSFPAFTLLELLVVITIIGVLTSILILDFVGVRERQQVSLLADQSVAVLQQTRGDVQGGKVRTETASDGSEEKIFLCEGAFFEEENGVLLATADYDAATGACDWTTLETEFYGLSTGDAFVESVSVNSATVNSLYVMYTPPEGTLVLYTDGGETSGDVLLTFNHSSEVELDISVSVSSMTGLVSLSLDDDEE